MKAVFCKFDGPAIGWRVTEVIPRVEHKNKVAVSLAPYYKMIYLIVDDAVTATKGTFCNPRKLLGL